MNKTNIDNILKYYRVITNIIDICTFINVILKKLIFKKVI
jgi:hypothetical protein